eukprot:Sdes_comp13333_c0_seq1m3143
MNPEKLAQLQNNVRIGGKGTVRRKKKFLYKNAAVDDKKLQQTLKKLGCNPIPGIEEVNFFKEDGRILHFVNPKLQAAVAANTFAISGTPEDKQFVDLLPKGILSQMGQESIPNLKKIAEAYQAKKGTQGEDEDMPQLVENFEEVSNKKR